MYEEKRVAVGMPAYNEAPNISSATEAFLSQEIVDEVIVVDNNSDDETAELASKAGACVIEESEQGYGYACQRAFNEMADSADILVLVEPDGTFVAEDIEKLLAYSNNFDFVLGTRTSQELIWNGANMGSFLRWGNWFVAKVLQLTHNTSALSDVGCTFRLINVDAYRKIADSLSVGESHFSPEMIIQAANNDISMIEIPVNYRPRKGQSKITGDRWPAFKLGLVMLALIFKKI